jgi:hypothetical protein
MTEETVSCASNLGPRQGARRFLFGVLMFAAAAAGLVVMVHRGLPHEARLALLPVWWAGFVGLLEARRRT